MNIDVGIQDLMLDIHGVTWSILCSRAKERKYYIEQYGKQRYVAVLQQRCAVLSHFFLIFLFFFYVMEWRNVHVMQHYNVTIGISLENFTKHGINMDDPNPLWIDIFIFLMRNAYTFYKDHEDVSPPISDVNVSTNSTTESTTEKNNSIPSTTAVGPRIKTFIALFDRGCPAAKYLKHNERYKDKEGNLVSMLFLFIYHLKYLIFWFYINSHKLEN